MADPDTEATQDKQVLRDKQVLNMLAFALFEQRAGTSLVLQPATTPDGIPEAVTPAQCWRSSMEVREAEYANARDLMQRLEKAGLGIRVSSSAKLEDAVEELLTIPARKAYQL